MSNEIKEFSEIKDPSSIDFDSCEWSWGFGFENSNGVIYHLSKDSDEITEYRVPKFMAEMIVRVRDAALDDLKRKIKDLDDQREELLKT
jgi:hypothetical protein